MHALNILRVLYGDASLGLECFPYIAEGARLAILGFSHPNWAVRNSSLMAYSAIIKRAIKFEYG